MWFQADQTLDGLDSKTAGSHLLRIDVETVRKSHSNPQEICLPLGLCEHVQSHLQAQPCSVLSAGSPSPGHVHWAVGPLAARTCFLPPTSNTHAPPEAQARSTHLRGPLPCPGTPDKYTVASPAGLERQLSLSRHQSQRGPQFCLCPCRNCGCTSPLHSASHAVKFLIVCHLVWIPRHAVHAKGQAPATTGHLPAGRTASCPSGSWPLRLSGSCSAPTRPWHPPHLSCTLIAHQPALAEMMEGDHDHLLAADSTLI